jgi:hypothetical protein
MEEIKCSECGAVLTSDMLECPNCGCPVENMQADSAAHEKNVPVQSFSTASESSVQLPTNTKKKLSLAPCISLILGLILMLLGFKVTAREAGLPLYDAKSYNVSYAAFGADFYTEIYGATDTIVDELSDINEGIGSLSESLNTIATVINYAAGMVIIAIGLGVVSVSILHMKKS